MVDSLFESDPRFIARIESLRQSYQREGGTSIDDVRKELGLSKKQRRKKSKGVAGLIGRGRGAGPSRVLAEPPR